MKINKHIYTITLAFLFLSSAIIGQISKGDFLIEADFLIDFDDIYTGNPPCSGCPDDEISDFSFNWGSGFSTAFANLALLEAAEKAEYSAWYRRQQNLIKEEIEKKLNTSFGSFDEAKNAFFSHSELKNTNKNTPPLKSKYRNSYYSGRSKNNNYLKELKSLQLREGELRAGNINNSQFPFIEVRGIPLKDITSLSTISQYRSTIEGAFGDNTWRTYEYKYILEQLNYLGSTFDAEVLRLKNKYYNSFSDWDKLGLMQFLLNYEQYKDLINCGVCLLPNELYKFVFSDIATRPFIEDYAKKNRGGSVSLFDPRYPQIYRFKYQNNFCGGAIDYAEWQKDKKEALDKLVDNTSTAELKVANLIGELEITDDKQKRWLYAHASTEAQKIIDFLNDNRVNGFASTQAIGFAKDASEIFTDLGSFNVSVETYTFDALNNPWLKFLREYAKRLEQIKNGISKKLYDALTKQLDHNFSVALTKTAFKLNPNADDTKEGNKEYWFKNDGKKGVGYLLYEFANGTGKDKRSFPFDYDMTQQMLAGNLPNDIKADFLQKLKDKNLTFNQFVSNGKKIDGNYSFSPDHTGIIDSFNKHINANWVQFFIGGTSTKYYPSSDPGWIIVELTNPTSRNSLLLHVAESYNRDGSGINKPLSTIWQTFRFKLKIK